MNFEDGFAIEEIEVLETPSAAKDFVEGLAVGLTIAGILIAFGC